MRFRRVLSCLAVAATALSLQAGFKTTAQAAQTQPTVVSAVPATYTPDYNNGIVYGIAQVGTQIIVGGTFTTESNHGSSTVLTTKYLTAFNASTGVLNASFSPTLDGVVNGVTPGPSANTVYVTGAFNNVNGVKNKSVILLNTTTGAVVTGFKAPAFDGVGNGAAVVNGHLIVVGQFANVAGKPHSGIVSLNPTTGAVDTYTNIQLTEHHNYGQPGGGSSNSGVGGARLAVNPAGTRMVVIGNFKKADGVQHDQVVMIDLTSTSATTDAGWNTLGYTASCYSNAYDSYIRGVDFSPDGSYFVIVATGGSGNNSDGTRSLCDSAARWQTTDTGVNVQPTWVDYTGNDTLLSVQITGTAIYVGGHQRWLNNPNAYDRAGAGSVPRPGLAALDPANGLPLTWNPGRNPRGGGAWALLATSTGLYVGSDTNYIGNYKYLHKRVAYFPLAGGTAPASTATRSLPANVYEAGPLNSATSGTDDLAYRAYSGTTIGAQTTVPSTGITWSTSRGAFMVGSTIFYGTTAGTFYRTSFNGTTVGTPQQLDPYNDPTWSDVDTGSGNTYRGVVTGYYGELPNVTGAFYSDGRLYYSLSGDSTLHWRYFTPDSGIVGGTEFSVAGGNFANTAGEFLSNGTIYYANATDGTLHTVAFSDGGTNGANPSVDASTDTVVSGPALDGNDWRARALFAYGDASFPNQPPTASATASCTTATCNFNGTASSDPDGTIASYAWNFGDGNTGTGPTPTYTYGASGTYNYTLTVTDNRGATSPVFTGSVTVTVPVVPPIAFSASAHSYTAATTSAKVTTPSTVAAGDTELLFVTAGNASATTSVIGTPSGWAKIGTQNAFPLQTAVFQRTATASDAGSSVTTPLSASSAVSVQLVDYAQVGSTAISVTTASDANTATHVAPTGTVSKPGSWVVSFWADRSSTTTGWTLPASVTSRDVNIGTGGGRVTGAIGDSNGTVSVGTYPTRTATVNAASGKGATMTLVLAPTG